MKGVNNLFATRMQGTESSPVGDLLRYAQMEDIISLAGGVPAADTFDIEGINLAMEAALGAGVSAFQYSVSEGELGLREEIVKLVADRGVVTNPDQLLLTNGSQQGLDLVARVFLNEGDTILVERPTYLAALEVFQLCNANIVDVEGDDDGINVDALEARLQEGKIKALYVVPTFANPTGSTIKRENRQRIVDLAAKHNFVIFEDDPYGEIRFSGDREPTMYELSLQNEATKGHVIYLSSFSKILVPGLRLGFIVAEESIRNMIVNAKQSLDLHTPVLGQLMVEAYLKGGRVHDHVPFIAKTYYERAHYLMDSLRHHLNDQITFNEPEGGMFLWGHLNDGIDSGKLLEIAAKEGVVFIPGSAFYVNDPDHRTLRLSFATIGKAEADEAGRRLAKALAKY